MSFPLYYLLNVLKFKYIYIFLNIKHEKACLDNQHVFIPFAFDTFGFLAPEAVDLLNRVQRVMHSNVMTPRSMDVVFKRLSFAIQKGVAAQLVARLPTISM
ncbi:hypothetical protein Hanom_Chr15g01340861 [Helianthus anomalus]